MLRPEKISVVSEDKIELRFTANTALENKIQELKGLLAHKLPHPSTAELFEILCDTELEKIKSAKTATPMKPRRKESLSQIRRHIWQLGQHKCSNCQSSYAVEIDHRVAKAKGGDNSKTNLRLLCRSCNQRSAIRQLGIRTMEQYLT